MNIRRLRLRALPQIEAAAAHEFFQGWWNGIAVGVALGAALAIILLKR